MAHVIVVGNGLFGAIAAELAKGAGHRITTIDCAQPLAASKCSGNLFKTSWLDGLGAERREVAFKVLNKLYSVKDIECVIRPSGLKTILHWVDPREVLLPADIQEEVIAIYDGKVRLKQARELRGKVLVAAGVWSDTLVNMPRARWLMGCSFRVPGQIKQPAINLWAPYKHQVVFNESPNTIWYGDGQAILEKNWGLDNISRAQIHAEKAFKLNVGSILDAFVGARPYVPGFKSGYFAQVYPNTWVSTGGAKNGLVIAAYQAQQFLEAI
jgi:hypothetical protein